MAGSIDKGMFNFQGVMNKFYNYQPKKDDSEGRAIKNSFMANMIQSGFDAQMAKDMAQTQSSLAKSNMITAADLEARNTKANMDREFNYGMQTMGAQFKLQNQFADNQYKRDLGMQAAANLEGRKNIGAQGAQDRLTAVVTGEQSRLNTAESGKQTRLNTQTAGDETRKTDTNRIRVSGDETRLTDTNRIRVTGDEQRENMREANRLEAKTRADQSRYSSRGARNF